MDFSDQNPFVALTYAEDLLMDGAGAQLQRMYCIYALSRYLGISYIHTPLLKIGYHGLTALEENRAIEGMTERYNKRCTIPSNVILPEHYSVTTYRGADLDFLCGLKYEAQKKASFHLIRLGTSHPLSDKHPQMLRYIREISPFHSTPFPLFKIAVHVRRGDLFVSEGERMLPNSYYIEVILKIEKVLRALSIPFSCHLYTESPSKPFKVHPHDHGIFDRIEKTVTLTPEMNHLEDFDALPFVQKEINGDSLETLEALATADLLVMSRSAFSYTAGILNKKGVMVYHPFWYGAPLEWLDATHAPSFEERLRDACSRWKTEQCSSQGKQF